MPATLLFFLKIKKKVLNTSFTFGEPVLIQKESVHFSKFGASPVANGKESTCNAGDLGSIPGSGSLTWRTN